MSAPTPSNAVYGSDESGLVCGFMLSPNASAAPISADTALAWLANADARPGEFVWLHFNLSNVAADRWLNKSVELGLPLSPLFFETLTEGSRSTRVEYADDQLIAVLNDVVFDFSFDPSQVSTLVLSVGPRFLVTARNKSLRSVDRLRVAVKNGEHFPTPTHLLVHLLRDQADVLVAILRKSIEKVDSIEDRLLAGRVEPKRAELGQLRRVLVRLKRLLAPEPGALFRLLSRPPDWMGEDDLAELRQSTEEFSVSLNDIDTLQERIKLLQEEISALVQEQNNRSLWVLSLFTVLALPVNMIAGFFGMNVGGIPLAQNEAGFAIVVSVVLSITAAIGWWIFRRRNR